MAGKVVVVSPFVGDKNKSSNLSEFSSNVLENRFVQNQLLRQGTSLAGPTLIAAGSTMQIAGDAPRTEFRSHLKSRDTAGRKSFKPYTAHGRRYTKPLGKSDFARSGKEFGYQTNYKSKTGIKKSPGKAKTGRALKGAGRTVSRFAAPIGIGLVGYNIYRHGAQQTVQDEAKFNWSFSPVGMLDEHLLGNRIETTFSPKSGLIGTVDNLAKMALLEALL